MKQTFHKIRFLIGYKQKKQIILLLFLLLVAMFLEVLGIGIILPVILVLLDPSSFLENIYVVSIFGDTLSQYPYEYLVLIIMLSLIILYGIKSLYLVLVIYKQNIDLESLYSSLTRRLYDLYLNQEYSFYLSQKTSELIKNIQAETNNFTSYCRSLISTFVELSLAFSVLVTILIIEFKGAITIGIVFGILSMLYYKFSKSKLKEWGSYRQEMDSLLYYGTIESFAGIKQIKLNNKEVLFSKRINNFLEKKRKVVANYQTISQVPRYYLEMISIIGLAAFIIYFIYGGRSSTELISNLGIFVAATFRIIPSINKIIAGLQNMKYFDNSISLLYNEFKSLGPVHSAPFNLNNEIFKREISIKKLNFRYKSDQKNILEDISFSIKKNETVGIVGTSGSGKSTLVDLINGLLKPSSGEICVDNININQQIDAWQQAIGYVGQDVFLFNDSILNNICFFSKTDEINQKRLESAIKFAQLTDFIKKSPKGLYTLVGERGIQLSGGQKQRIGIARALYKNPQLMIFDEATASLDDRTELEVMRSVYKLKNTRTLLIIAHRLSTLKNCDRILDIKDGKIKEIDIIKFKSKLK
ncbi:MAG: ABC transporter ATP-binding protein [Flavobacteriaceae bacterium]